MSYVEISTYDSYGFTLYLVPIQTKIKSDTESKLPANLTLKTAKIFSCCRFL